MDKIDTTAIKQEVPIESAEMAVHYLNILLEVARESFLILDADLRVVSANPTFYHNFQVTPEETAGQLLYNLGNGQWDIPLLKMLLEKILPEKKIVRDYEVEHHFETIGTKTIVLNARRMDSLPLIFLAMEDITIRKDIEKKLAEYTEVLEVKVVERTKELIKKVSELETLNKSMVGRELKMAELKKEVEKLTQLTKVKPI